MCILFAVGLGACVVPARRAVGVPPPVIVPSPYIDPQRQFSAGAFCKPREPAPPWLPLELAPLIVQELVDVSTQLPAANRFGAVRRRADGTVYVDTDWPTVYAGRSRTALCGAGFDQLVFRWWYPPADAIAERTTLVGRGIRVTLDSEGLPMIWEVLGGEAGATQVYVARWLEDAAVAAFGPPLSHRRYSIERAYDECPQVAVLDVLDDGPTAMGPVVYVEALTRAVIGVTCRCMPSRVDDLPVTDYYELRPLEQLTSDRLRDPRAPGANSVASNGVPSNGGASKGLTSKGVSPIGRDRLESILRLPDAITE